MAFSIIIPLYNTEKYIKRSVNSVLNQSYRDLEVIVVDDGSTDKGVSVVEEMMKSEPRLQLLKQKNQLVGAARNYGIRQAKNEYVGFLDADDEYLPDFLETVNKLVSGFPQAGIYATAYKVQKEDKSFVPKFSGLPAFPWEGIVPSYYKSGLGYHPLSSSSVVTKKSVLNDVGYFAEGVRYTVDLDLWVRIAAKYDIAFSSDVCAVYHREVGLSLSIEKRTNFERKVEDTLEEIIKNKAYKKGDEYYIKEYYNKLHLDTATKYIRTGNKEKAKEHLDKVQTKKFRMKKLKMRLKLFFG